MPEGVLAAATFMRSVVVGRTAAHYKPKYTNCFDVRQFNAMFLDDPNLIMYDRRGFKRDTDIGGATIVGT